MASLTSSLIRPGFLAMITFHTSTQYVWSGLGNLVWNGNTYKGVGSLGRIGGIDENTDLRATGTTVTLSAIDPALLADCLNDIQLGAPVAIYFALFDGSLNILGTPYPLFIGTVDQPTIQIGADSMSIALKCENKLVNLQRANMRRYTAADQRKYFPNDTGFNWVELLNDMALKWS